MASRLLVVVDRLFRGLPCIVVQWKEVYETQGTLRIEKAAVSVERWLNCLLHTWYVELRSQPPPLAL